jgi:predicted  nucleic acid-binding Zn-ribbon protein
MGGGAQMRLQIRVIRDDGTECSIEGIARDDWNTLHDRCPECGNREFNHFRASGGHYGPYENTVVERSNFWDTKQRLYTRCRSCAGTAFSRVDATGGSNNDVPRTTPLN